jgi:2-polyprenyl-3-methyl-5-hydroxy-6-metoxy-1,4-benzoquinol methylase
MTVEDIGEYDVITFNKVLEHVEQPIEMLKKAKSFLNKNGFIYVEVPDGEMAAMEGKEREEFFIDHIHVFSFTSLSLLIQKSWLLPLVIERLKEPSTKYTIRAFCSV